MECAQKSAESFKNESFAAVAMGLGSAGGDRSLLAILQILMSSPGSHRQYSLFWQSPMQALSQMDAGV